jgi:hypothetical protein
MVPETNTFSRDFFYFIKKNYQCSVKEQIEVKLKEIDVIIDKIIVDTPTQNNNNSKNWRNPKPKSLIDKDSLSKEELIINSINSLLNKLAPKNYELIESKTLEICKENKDNKETLEKIIDSVFLKAVMQSTYCPYYVKLINKIIENEIDIINVINSKSKEYQIMLKMENNTKLTSTEKETYDEFCEKIKNKTYKAGYSQFIGELLKNNIIEKEIISSCLSLFIENVKILIENDINDESIEDNIICIYNLVKTTFKMIQYEDIMLELGNIRKTSDLQRRLKFKIMDLEDILKKKDKYSIKIK